MSDTPTYDQLSALCAQMAAALEKCRTEFPWILESLREGKGIMAAAKVQVLKDEIRPALTAYRTLSPNPQWQPIETAKKNASWMVVWVPDKNSWLGGYPELAHWASDLSGSEQPAFQGWFRRNGDGFIQLPSEPTHWCSSVPRDTPNRARGEG